MLWNLVRRWRCHHSTVCCQYTDDPMCNGPHDPHWRGRRRWAADQRRDQGDETYRGGYVYDPERGDR